jgi:hypothetical protein
VFLGITGAKMREKQPGETVKQYLQYQLREKSAEVERLREFVKSLRDFRTKDHVEGKDRGEYGFALYGQSGEMLDVTGTDALDAWQKLDGGKDGK